MIATINENKKTEYW